MSLIALFTFTSSLAFAADPFSASPAIITAPADGVVTVRTTSELTEASTIAVIMTCGSEYEAEALALLAAVTPRSDIGTLVTMWNPSAAEVRDWFSTQLPEEMGPGKYRLGFIGLACGAEGGDTDEEVLRTRNSEMDGGLPFVDLVVGVRSLTISTIWLIDTSRDGYGATGDDVPNLGGGDALAISTGPPGTMADGGLLGAAAGVIENAKGGPLTLEGFYYLGIKQRLAGTDLNLHTSMGRMPGDEWNGNRTRLVLPGGPLIEPGPTPFITPAIPLEEASDLRKPVPTGCWVAGAGLLTGVVGGGFNFGIAASDQRWIADVNDGIIDASDTELNAGISHMRRHELLGGIFTGIGAAAIVGGTIWTGTTVHATPHGIELRGHFR